DREIGDIRNEVVTENLMERAHRGILAKRRIAGLWRRSSLGKRGDRGCQWRKNTPLTNDDQRPQTSTLLANKRNSHLLRELSEFPGIACRVGESCGAPAPRAVHGTVEKFDAKCP